MTDLEIRLYSAESVAFVPKINGECNGDPRVCYRVARFITMTRGKCIIAAAEHAILLIG